MTLLLLSRCSQTPCNGKASSLQQKCKLQGIQRSSQAVRSHWPDIINFHLPHCFFFFKLGLCMTFQKSRNFCERFTSQDIAVGVHQWMATYSVSCLFLSRSQPSCCPCCFFFLPRLKCWCLFLYLRSLGFNSKNLQSKCNYCLSCLCHWQLH